MKTLYKVSVLGCLLIALVASAAQVSLAQGGDEKRKGELYDIIVAKYASDDLGELKEAAKAGDEYLQKFGSDTANKEFVDWLKSQLPGIKTNISEQEAEIIRRKKQEDEENARAARFSAFNTAHESKNWNQKFTVGDQIVQKDTAYALDVTLELAKTAFRLAFDDTKNENPALVPKAVSYTQSAINMLESGKKSETKNYGVFSIFKNKKYTDGKSNALGEMNYQMGWLKFYGQKNRQGGIPYFYKASKYKSFRQVNDLTYSPLADWYIAKVREVIGEQNKILEQRNAEVQKPEQDVEKIKELDFQIDTKVALAKGFAERAIDANLRAYSLLPAADKEGAYGKRMYSTLKQLYKIRYQDDKSLATDAQMDAKINMNVSSVNSKELPDPSSSVQPIGAPIKPAKTDATDEKKGETRSRTVSGSNR